MRRDFRLNRKYIGIVIGIFAILIILFGVSNLFSRKSASTTRSSNVEQISVAPAKARIDLNNEFSFPLLNNKDEEVSKIKYVVENAELQDEIVVSGKKATSIKGKTFLIINLKITNDFNKPININTRDYIRLVVNNNDKELLAPEIHNDPVEVLAISTKYTRVGFTVNDADKSLKLKVGEIKKDKTDIDLSFTK